MQLLNLLPFAFHNAFNKYSPIYNAADYSFLMRHDILSNDCVTLIHSFPS